MNWIKNIFKRPQTNTNKHIQLHPVEHLIKDHLSKLESQFKRQQNHETFKTRWKKLLQSDIMDFVVTTTIDGQDLQQNPSLRSYYRNGKIFGDLLIVVSVIPALFPEKAKTYFGGGYLTALDEFPKKLNINPNNTDFAHWTVCHENDRAGVHLTFIPSVKFMDSYNIGGVWAQDLMTLEEKKRIGLF